MALMNEGTEMFTEGDAEQSTAGLAVPTYSASTSSATNVFTLSLPPNQNYVMVDGSNGTLRKLKTEVFKNVAVEEPKIDNINSTGLAKFIIKLQSLLQTLKNEDVRADFLAGKIIKVNDHESILSSFDLIRSVLFPDWTFITFQREASIEIANHHFNLLWERSTVNFQLPGLDDGTSSDCNYSYSAWAEAIDEMFGSNYWDEINKQDLMIGPDPTMGGMGIKIENNLYSAGTSSRGYQRDIKDDSDKIRIESRGYKPYVRRKKTVSDDAKIHKCTECEYASSRLHVLETHVNTVHKGLRPHKCTECSDSFGHSSTLKTHINTVHRGLKPYKCSECNCAYAHLSSLKTHINTVHKGLKPYKCNECSYAAGQLSNLKTHINLVHKGLKRSKKSMDGMEMKGLDS